MSFMDFLGKDNPVVGKDQHGTMFLGMKGVIMPLPFGNGGGKAITGKGAAVLLGIFAVIVAIVIAVASYLAKPNEKIPAYQILHDNIGKPVSVIARQLELEEDALVQLSDGVYISPEKYKYLGVEFELVLYFEQNEDLLNRFEYRSAETVDAKTAAKNIAKLSEQLYTQKTLSVDGEELSLSEKSLRAHFEAGKSLKADSLQLQLQQNISTKPVKQYCEYLEQSEYWEGKVDKYIVRHACYYEDLHMAYDPQTQQQTVRIVCTVEADRNY